jgi:hypothetical protein
MEKTTSTNNTATPRGQTEVVLRELGWSTNTCREDTVQAWKSEGSGLTFFVDDREIWVEFNVTVTAEQIIWMACAGETVGSEGGGNLVKWSNSHPINQVWVRKLHKMVVKSENVMNGGRA